MNSIVNKQLNDIDRQIIYCQINNIEFNGGTNNSNKIHDLIIQNAPFFGKWIWLALAVFDYQIRKEHKIKIPRFYNPWYKDHNS